MFQWWCRSTTKDFHFLHPRKIVGLSFLVYYPLWGYQFRSVWILTLWLMSDHSPKMMISRGQILLRWPCRDAIWTVKVKVKVGITLYDMLSYKTKQILSILINESTSTFHADKIDRTYIHGVGQERLPSGLTMDPHFNRKFVDPVVFPSQLWLIRRYLKIHCAHPMTHIAGDHRSSGEDFPYLSSHNGSVEREPMESIASKGNVPGLATFYFPLNHDYWRKHYIFQCSWTSPSSKRSIGVFGLETTSNSWSNLQTSRSLKRGSSKINGFDSLISVSFLWPTKKGLWSWKWCAAPGGSRPHGRCLRRKSFKWFRFDAKKAAFWNFDVLHDVHIDLIYVHSNVSESNAWLMYLWRVVWKRLFLKRSEALRPEWL